jgi:hypothetical protein
LVKLFELQSKNWSELGRVGILVSPDKWHSNRVNEVKYCMPLRSLMFCPPTLIDLVSVVTKILDMFNEFPLMALGMSPFR